MILVTSAKLIDLHLGVHIKAAYHQLSEDISPLYDSREAKNIADWIMEELTGWDRSKRLIHQDKLLDESQLEKLNTYKEELLAGKPIQYILSKAWFMGSSFYVDERVLIPRPETEELVDLIKHKYQDLKNVDQPQIRVVDIGTGSGCIDISLKKIFPDWEIWAIDKSLGALDVTNKNAASHRVELIAKQLDILNHFKNDSLPTFDIIVSNPPYIPFNEKVNMQIQVKNYEPALALFVTNEDPLIFYRIIARLAKQCLNPNGQLFFEMHYDQGKAIQTLFDEMGYHAELRKDMFGKDRMIRASLKPKQGA
jgi:release factor glutamine methyltransferase